MTDNKIKLRAYYKALRQNLSDKPIKDKLIYNRFVNSNIYKNTKCIFFYASLSDEVDTYSLIEKALLDKKTVALPKCNKEKLIMTFYEIESLKDLEKGSYGILEPVTCLKKASFDENTLCVVPGLAFDKEGYRLGYGKGYYDRFLTSFVGKSVGLCYDEGMCDKLITNIYDISVSQVITDKEIYHIK